MAELIEIRVPDIGGAVDVEVIELIVQEGDEVDAEQGLISVETDKATMEIPSSQQGVIAELKVEVGSKVSEGDLIALLQPVDSTGEAGPEATSVPDEDVGATTTETSQQPEKAQEVLSAPDQPATVDVPVSASASRTAGDDLAVKGQLVYASPSIRRLARELDVPLEAVQGTGDRGRITRQDVYNYIMSALREKSQSVVKADVAGGGRVLASVPWPTVDFERHGHVDRMALSRIRKISGPNLHRNWVSIPHVTNHEDADITDLESFRIELNNDYGSEGVKVTLLALVIKAAVAALRAFPEFNASLDGEEMVLKRYYHIGFAADTPNGLLVPVIRNADQKGILGIAREISELAAKAREGKLGIDDMNGGTFSISSLGGIGGTYFTPIINAPEVAILGVSKARIQLIWDEEKAAPVPRLMLPMSLSWDHRVVDGAMAGRFNAFLSSVLADVRRILI